MPSRRALRWSLLALTCAVSPWGCNSSKPMAGQSSDASFPVVLGPESVVEVQAGVIESGPLVSGTLQARQSANVRARVGGAVLETLADRGDALRRGQPVVRIDDVTLRDQLLAVRSAVRSARNALSLATDELARFEKLAAAGGVSQSNVDRARVTVQVQQAQLADARARLASAKEQLGNTRVGVPFDGIVSERPVNLGDIVQPGDPLFTVVDLANMRLDAAVPAEFGGELRPGIPVEFRVSGYAQRFTGQIEAINPVVAPQTGQIRIYVTIPNEAGPLRAGLFAEGRVAIRRSEGLAAPVAAVDQESTPPSVTRIRDGRAERVPVVLGLHDGLRDRIELRGGVEPGDVLVSGPARAELDPGATVRIAVGGSGSNPADAGQSPQRPPQRQ